MSNRNQHTSDLRGGSSSSYSHYAEDDSVNYQDAYAAPYAPRAETRDVHHLENDFTQLNLQDSSSYGHGNSQYAYDNQRLADPESYAQGPQYDASLPPSTTAKYRTEKTSKSSARTGREPKTKGKGKGHSKKENPPGPTEDVNYPLEPFFEAKPGSAVGQEYHPTDTSGSSYSADSRITPTQPDYGQSRSYTHGSYGQEDVYPEGSYTASRGRQDQDGGYDVIDHSQGDFLDPQLENSRRQDKHLGKQRDDYHYGKEERHVTYEDPSAAASSESYIVPGESQYYPPSNEEPYGHDPGSFSRARRPRETKTSGKRSKREVHQDEYSNSTAYVDFPPDGQNLEHVARGEEAGGDYRYHSSDAYGEASYPPGAYNLDPEEEGSRVQTPRPEVPSDGDRSATQPSPSNYYEPYHPVYPQPTEGEGAYGPSTYTHDPAYNLPGNSYEPYPAGPSQSYYGPSTDADQVLESTTPYGDHLDNSFVDPRYTVQPSSRFSPGAVFKALWAEPLGGGLKDKEAAPTEIVEQTHMGQRFYTGFRRFIVVANDQGHCTCVPILTYERRACTKKGVKAHTHGIIYAAGGRPISARGEPTLGFRPVRLQFELATEKLAPESRVNYSKLVGIEHNIPVLFIGRVHPDDVDTVGAAVDDCWNKKIRKGNESQHHHSGKHRDQKKHGDHRGQQHRY